MSARNEGAVRLCELLADRACGQDLAPREAREAELLLALHPELDDGSFERAAAALHLALLGALREELPAGLRDAVLSDAHDWFAARAASPASPERHREPRRAPVLARPWWGWIAAAAALLLLVLRPPAPGGEAAPTRAEVLAAPDLVTCAWKPTDDPDGRGVDGEVLWSDALQAGYMRFHGLPANDPERGQYQLWIFDADHPAETPVDGGVFDATAEDTWVPIVAKLAVREPSLFAITYERPGGVVVSTRERLLLTAAGSS